MEQHEHDDFLSWYEAMQAANQAIEANLEQIIAQMDARDRLWRGEDGFDG